MKPGVILLLEDHPRWREEISNKLGQRLENRGYQLRPVANGDANIAISIANETDVACAIVDEVLEVNDGDKKGAYQHLQGSDVVRQFEMLQIPCIVVSDVALSIPIAEDSMDYALSQGRRLKKPGNVIDFYHKRELRNDDTLYDQIFSKILAVAEGWHGKGEGKSTFEFVVRVCVDEPPKHNNLLQQLRESPNSSAEKKEELIWTWLLTQQAKESATFQFGCRPSARRFTPLKPQGSRLPDRWSKILLRLAVRQICRGELVIRPTDYTQPKIAPSPTRATDPRLRGQLSDKRVREQGGEILVAGGAAIWRPSRPLDTAISRIRKDIRSCLGNYPKCADREWPFQPLPDHSYRFQESIQLEFVPKR